MKRKEFTQKDFKFIKWSADEIKVLPSIAIIDLKSKIAEIKKIKKENRSFENTVLAFENADNNISGSMSYIGILEMVSDKKEIREAARIASVEFQEKVVDINHDIELYKSIKDYYENNYKLEKEKLEKDSIKLVEDYVRSFKRMGFDLPIKERNKIKTIEKKISKLSNEYDSRLAEDSSHIICSEEEMMGIPEIVKSSFEKIGKGEDVKYKVGISYPEFGPFMKYSMSREKRKELYIKFNNQGGERNVKILEDLIKLRQEKAKMLGFKSHADYVISDRMAKSVDVVYKMLNDILSKLKNKKNEEIDMIKDKWESLNSPHLLTSATKENGNISTGFHKLEVSDVDFVVNKIKEEKYNIDDQKLREYFSLDHVMSEMFKFFGELFGFEVIKTDIKLWHKDAFLCEIRDKQSKSKENNLIGYIGFDLFPREGKFGHACMMPTKYGYSIDENNYKTSLGFIICNFSKPQNKINSKNYIPSLLTLGEVETIFHEFGHALHHVMTNAKYESQAGTNVLWDFVEAPSQIMEEYMLEEKVLKKVSKHYKTDKSLSKTEIEKIINVSKFMKGSFYTRQTIQALLDIDIYTGRVDDSKSSSIKHFHKLMRDNLYELFDEVLFVSRFAHIARGYDAGYYSYLWAERIAKDFYSKFKQVEANKKEYKKIGEKYRKEILEVGSSRDESDSAKLFLGRDVDNKAFVESLI